MGKNKEEFMRDREQEINTWAYWKREHTKLTGELEEKKHLLSKCKTLISYYDDVIKHSQELLTELKDY